MVTNSLPGSRENALDHPPPQFEGSGFLYKMVRQLTGAVLAIGHKKLKPEFICEQLAIGNSKSPGGPELMRLPSFT